LKPWHKNPTIKSLLTDFNQLVRLTFIKNNLNWMLGQVQKDTTSHRILDVGAGPGLLSASLDRMLKCFVVNVEIRLAHKTKNLVLAEGIRLPFMDEAFDFIVASDVLEHIEETKRELLITELIRCTQSGAVVTYSKLHKDNPERSGIKVFEMLCSPNSRPDWYLEHNEVAIVDDSSILNMLTKNNCQVFESTSFGGIFTLFFIGTQCRITSKLPRFILNLTAFMVTRLLDPGPYYSKGLAFVKNKFLRRKDCR
jgi:2-polyprenyl-3-methyl-5-hydroxy-6-metoxy-1,4-benzoquinol methylase